MKQELNDSGIIVYDMHDDYSRGRSSASRKAREHIEQEPSDNTVSTDTEKMKKLGGFSGKVYDKLTYRTITGARVTIATDLIVKTDERGNFQVTGIRPGNYRLRVDEEGYIVQSRKGTAIAGEITTINAFHLVPDCLAAERPQDVEWDENTDENFTEFALDPVLTTETGDQIQSPQVEEVQPIMSAAPAAPDDEPDTGVGPCIDTALLPDVDVEFDIYEIPLLMDSDAQAASAEEIRSELIEQCRVFDNIETGTNQEHVAHVEHGPDNHAFVDVAEQPQNPSVHSQPREITGQRAELSVESKAPDANARTDAQSLSIYEIEQESLIQNVCESSAGKYLEQQPPDESSVSRSSNRVGNLWQSFRKKTAREPELYLSDEHVQDEQTGTSTQESADGQSGLKPSASQSDGLPNITVDPKPRIDTLRIPRIHNAAINIESCNSPEFEMILRHPQIYADTLNQAANLHEHILLSAAPVIEQNVLSISMEHNQAQEVSISEYPAPVFLTGFDAPRCPSISNETKEHDRIFDQCHVSTGPCIQIKIDNSSTAAELFSGNSAELLVQPGIESLPSLPCLKPEADKDLAEKDAAGRPLKLVKETVRIRRRPEQTSDEDSNREEYAFNARTKADRENSGSAKQSKLLWWTKRVRRTPEPGRESEMTYSGTSAADSMSERQEQTTVDQLPATGPPNSSTRSEESPEQITAAQHNDTESVGAGIQESEPASPDTGENDPELISEQEKEAMSPDETEGLLAAGCSGTLKVIPNPAFKGLPITVTYQVKNLDCEDTDNARVRITIINPDDDRVLEAFESQITCKKGSFSIGGFTASTATFEAQTYRICMHIVTLDNMTYNPVTHIPLKIKSIY